MARAVGNELRDGTRALCCSVSRDVHPLWLHYADRYRGAVLHLLVPTPFVKPIAYRATKTPIADGDIETLQQFQAQAHDEGFQRLGRKIAQESDVVERTQLVRNFYRAVFRSGLIAADVDAKSLEWAHEQEVRIYADGSALSLTSPWFGNQRQGRDWPLQAVELGARVSRQQRNDLAVILADVGDKYGGPSLFHQIPQVGVQYGWSCSRL